MMSLSPTVLPHHSQTQSLHSVMDQLFISGIEHGPLEQHLNTQATKTLTKDGYRLVQLMDPFCQLLSYCVTRLEFWSQWSHVQISAGQTMRKYIENIEVNSSNGCC